MRTTVTLDDDVARAVEQMRREQGLGLSSALNLLARRGLRSGPSASATFTQRTSRLGRARIPLDDVASALEIAEGQAEQG